MIPFYLATDLADAQLFAEWLEEAGIATFIRNRELQGMLGLLPLTAKPEVCVLHDADLPRAEVLKAEYRQLRKSPIVGEEWRCAACGESNPPNFEICWSCEAPAPVG